MAGRDAEGGALFSNSRKEKQNHPDYRGELHLHPDVVRNLMDQLQQGVQFPMIEISGWKKMSGRGTVYVSLSGKKPYVKDTQSGQRQAPQGGFNQSGDWPGTRGAGGGSRNDIEDTIPF